MGRNCRASGYEPAGGKMRGLSVSMRVIGLFLCVLAGAASAEELRAHVVAVSDGDTIRVIGADNHPYVVRLANVDAPETSCHQFNQARFEACSESAQPYGKAAKKSLYELVFDQSVRIVTVEEKNSDGQQETALSYDRIVGTVFVGDLDVNYEQVRRGYAWHAKSYAGRQQPKPVFSAYAEAEDNARAKHLGLWEDNTPVPPWTFRHAGN